MELDERKLRILAAITEVYLDTGEPAGSKLIANMLGGEVSPATIRNEMAALYDMGLLEQPHTSAGRVPSHLGIRLYIDKIMKETPLTSKEKHEIDALFNRRNPDPDRLLEDSVEALADLTGCAAITTTLCKQNAFVKKIELIPASARTVVILLIASNGMIKHKVCRVDFNLTPRVVDFFTSYANSRIVGRSINEVTTEYINSILFDLGEYTDLFAPLFTAIYDICREASDGKLYHCGEINLLEFDELKNVADKLFKTIQSRDKMLEFLASGTGGDVKVSIGRESQRPELNNSSIIISHYKIGDDSLGAVGLIGPVNMDYAKLIPHLQYFSETLGKLINDTLQNDDINI